MKIEFLSHSGFLIDDGQRCYVFDYYKDPAHIVEKQFKAGRELWFFVSHIHHDHYNPEIKNFDSTKTQYIVHKDIPLTGVQHLHTLEPTEDVTIQNVAIHMYGSTDEGGSFLVDNGKKRIFHAGDLNWWHWLGDTLENIRFARKLMEKEFIPLADLTVDIALFPVDARLEEAREWGVLEFLKFVTVKELLVPMHYFGDAWEPTPYFKALHGALPLWIHQNDGEEFLLDE
ncbi:MAG: MBL fold metallo-hydrolase [Veillonella sp.]|uniref:MBL fold metallo-hydrolase n=1 Tax=Veillonella sp. TaxID=1926307 RepID=UPI001B6086F9|nr:MBL fold metallo-hydrolase [Veillonella sp.]MBP6923824.1 MBL fold metallo-hydrolase [Veillonella sp.]